MEDLKEKLRKLAAEACTHPMGSRLRQRKLSEIYRLVMKSGKLWKSREQYYNDALQEMWIHCCQNIDEYNPQIKGVITWLDDELKKRLRRYRDRKYRDQNRQITPRQTEGEPRKDPVARTEARPDIQPALEIWEETVNWVRTDPEEILSKTCFKHRSDINCQSLFLLRFPNAPPWKTIAEGFGLNEADTKYLPKWYNRSCLPLLRAFGVSQGYL